MSIKTRLEELMDQQEHKVQLLCEDMLKEIHDKFYEAIKTTNIKLVENYFKCLIPIFPQIHYKTYNPHTMGGNYFQRYSDRSGLALQFLDGIVCFCDEHEIGVPCIDGINVVFLSIKWIRITQRNNEKNDDDTQSIEQEIRTKFSTVLRTLSHKRITSGKFVFELEQILIEMI